MFRSFFTRLRRRMIDQSGKINLSGGGDAGDGDSINSDDLAGMDNDQMQKAFEDNFGGSAANVGKKPDEFQAFNRDDDDFSQVDQRKDLKDDDFEHGKRQRRPQAKVDLGQVTTAYLQKAGVLGKNQTVADLTKKLDRASEFESTNTKLQTMFKQISTHPDFPALFADVKADPDQPKRRKVPKAVEKMGDDGVEDMKETLGYLLEDMGFSTGDKKQEVTMETVKAMVAQGKLESKYPDFQKIRPLMAAVADMAGVSTEDRSDPVTLDKIYKKTMSMIKGGGNRKPRGGGGGQNQFNNDFLAGNDDGFSGMGGNQDLSSFSSGRSINRGTVNLIDQINSDRFPTDLKGQKALFNKARQHDGLNILDDDDFDLDIGF